MFRIHIEDFSGTEKIKLLNKSNGEYISVIQSIGANLNEMVLMKDGKLHNIIEGDKQAESLSGKGTNFYRGAKLSPFPNRVKNGRYNFEGREYQLAANAPPHALHGLCWNLPFSVDEQIATNEGVVLTLQTQYQSLYEGYPFSYQVEIEYTLEENKFKCATRILNTGKHNIPIGDGWHPYFTTGSKIDSVKLQLPACRQLELDETFIPTGKYLRSDLFAKPTLLGDTLLDHCFELEKCAVAETRLIDEEKNMTIVIWQEVGDKGYKYVQVYTPPDRDSIAIEPMSCAPDAFNNKKGLIVLGQGEMAEFSLGVRLE